MKAKNNVQKKEIKRIGNWRDHEYYWLLTDIYNDPNPVPAINGELYYSGHIVIVADDDDSLAEVIVGNVESEEDHLNCRSSFFGSALSGAYGGILAGFEGPISCGIP